MSYENDILMHHGIKGQKWGVRKYKEARSSGVKAYKKNLEAASRRSKASKRYIDNTNKMNENAAKRDAISNKLKSSTPNSAQAARYASKMGKYDSKAKSYSDKRNANEKDYNNADKDVSKYYDVYMRSLKTAANQKVEIKNHALAKTLIMAAFNMSYSPSSKDVFDENVMTYRSFNHSDNQTPVYTDSIEHHGVKGMKWGQRKSRRGTGSSTSSRPHSGAISYIQTRSANKNRAKQWRSQYNNRGSMSTEELRRAVNRLNLENQFDSATKQAMASSSKTIFSKYKDQYINGAMQGAVNTTNQVGNRVGQAAATAMIKRIGVAAAASV